MNQLSTITAAVKTLLSAATGLGQTFTALRSYTPDYDAIQDDDLRLFVYSQAEDISLHGSNTIRSACDHDYTVLIGIVKRLDDPQDIDELDGLSDFREKVIDHLKVNKRLASVDAVIMELNNSPVVNFDFLKKSMFVSVLTLKFKLLR